MRACVGVGVLCVCVHTCVYVCVERLSSWETLKDAEEEGPEPAQGGGGTGVQLSSSKRVVGTPVRGGLWHLLPELGENFVMPGALWCLPFLPDLEFTPLEKACALEGPARVLGLCREERPLPRTASCRWRSHGEQGAQFPLPDLGSPQATH